MGRAKVPSLIGLLLVAGLALVAPTLTAIPALADNKASELHLDLVEIYNRAIKNFSKAIESDPDNISLYIARGFVYGELGEHDKAIELDPDFAGAYNNRGLVYADLGEYNKALEDLDKAIELDPAYADAYINRGVTYYKMREYTQAVQDLEKYLELVPDAPNREQIIDAIEESKAQLNQ